MDKLRSFGFENSLHTLTHKMVSFDKSLFMTYFYHKGKDDEFEKKNA